MSATNRIDLRTWNEIQYLIEDRLSGKKTTFAHSVFFGVVTQKYMKKEAFTASFILLLPDSNDLES